MVNEKLQSSLLFISHFLIFAGYYAFLVILSNSGLIGFSRGLTIPLRILIIACLALIVVVNRKVYINAGARMFLVFSGIYIARILVEMMDMKIYHMDPSEFLLYYLAFGALPLLIVSGLKFSDHDYKVIRWSLLISGFLLSVMTLIYYRSLIGTVGRISSALTKDENYISPLALSYCGTLSMGIGIDYLLQKSNTLRNKFIVLVFVLFALVPFFLGASRGSIFALFIPFIVMFFSKSNPAAGFRMLFIMLITAVAGVYLSELFGSSLVDRFTNIESDMSEGNSSASRLQLWKDGFYQFLDHPIFGNSLELESVKNYPHNIIIEVLLTTGIIGFAAFTVLIVYGFKKTIQIYKYDPRNSWIGIIFIQSFIQHMFSGSLYGASWLWASLGLLFSYNVAIKRQSPAPYYN